MLPLAGVLGASVAHACRYCGDLPVHINWRAERGMPQMYDCEGSYMELLQVAAAAHSDS